MAIYAYLAGFLCWIVSFSASLASPKACCSFIEPYLLSFYLNIYNNLTCSSFYYINLYISSSKGRTFPIFVFFLKQGRVHFKGTGHQHTSQANSLWSLHEGISQIEAEVLCTRFTKMPDSKLEKHHNSEVTLSPIPFLILR